MSRDKGKNIFITCMSIILMLVIMGDSVVAAEKNSVTYGYANEEKTQVEATDYVPSDYAELYNDHMTMGETLSANGTEYPIVGISSSVFANTKLCSIIIKDRSTSFYIGQKAFENVSVLNPLATEGAGSITISCDVDTIGDYAFSNATVSNNIYIEGDVEKIGAYAFEEVTVPGTFQFYGNIDTIGKYAFKNAGMVIVHKFREAQEGAFYGTTINSLNAIEGMEILGDNAFENCTSLETVKLADSVTTIGANCFKGCTSLESITLPANSSLTIGENAFPNQEGLVVVIPSEITNINNYNFESLTNVVFQIDADCSSNVIQYFEENGMQYKEGAEGEIIQGAGGNAEEGTTSGVGGTTEEGSDPEAGGNTEEGSNSDAGGTTEGGSTPDAGGNTGEDGNTKPGNNGTTEAGGNTETGDNTGENDNNGGDTIINNNNTTNNDITNNNTTNNITNNNTVINNNNTVINNDTAGETEKEPVKGKTYTVKGMKYKVTSSTAVTFMKPVSKNIKKCTIPSTVEILGRVFKVTKINKKACYGYKKLTTVTIGDNVTTIGVQSFAKCTKLKTVTIGKGLKTIEKKAFYKDKKLKKMTIQSKKLNDIEKDAMKGVKLKKLTLANGASRKLQTKYERLIRRAQ